MLSNRIELESEIEGVITLIQKDSLENTHRDLQLQKGVIYIFISDEELLDVNRNVLQHDYYTDIITFDYSDDEDIEQSEILISWDRIKDNAEEFNQPVVKELHRVCIHGLLHLAGYNDETTEERNKMSALEDYYLNLYCST